MLIHLLVISEYHIPAVKEGQVALLSPPQLFCKAKNLFKTMFNCI